MWKIKAFIAFTTVWVVIVWIAYLYHMEQEEKVMKAIVSDKLYDTETSEIVFEQKPDEILYRTEKGNWFWSHPFQPFVEPINEEQAKGIISRYCPVERYIEVFGGVEKA